MVRIKTFIDEPQIGAVPAPNKPLEATIFVAASDARKEVKDLADFVCTGSNDQDIIAQAINSLPPAGGKVKLSEGTFVFNNTLKILRSNVTLEGCGAGTKIFLANGANAHVITVGNGSTALSNIKICNLLIDGNRANQTVRSNGIYFNGGSGFLITNSVIENCWITNCYGSGIYINYGNNNSVIGNVCQSNGEYGICLDNSQYNIVAENQVLSNTMEGIYVYSMSERNIIKGNVISSNNGNGIWIDSSSLQVISGNFIYGNQGVAIIASYSNHLVITSNNILENGKAGENLAPGAADIWIGSSTYCTVSNNICFIPTTGPGPDYGIRESDTSDYNMVSGNIVGGYKIKISLIGTNSKISGNIEV